MNKILNKKTITVRYFAQLREQANTNSEIVKTTADTATKIYDEISQRHDFSFTQDALRVAVNGVYADWDQTIGTGDEIVFIPPVAGG